jgi:hypothetical protein
MIYKIIYKPTALLIAFGLAISSLQGQSIWFRFNSGIESAYDLVDIQKITYGDDTSPSLFIHLNAGSVVSYAYSDILSFYFSDNSVSTEEREALSQNSFIVFPNPATSLATLNWISADGDACQIALRDIEGRLIHAETIANGAPGLRSHTIAIEHLPAGIYLCQLIGKTSSQSTRLIKN